MQTPKFNRALTVAHRVALQIKFWSPGALALLCLLLNAQTLLGALNTNLSTATMKVYESGVEKLTVYTDVPGHTNSVINGYPSRAKSDVYEIWVRSAATFSAAAGSNEWVRCFANMTYNRGLEMPIMPDFETATASHAYQKFTKGWTHTYANIEMSTNSPVEVEIRKIGTTLLNSSNVIFKSAVRPSQKASNHSNHLGRVYFTLTNPCQVVIDINGQMDDHNAAFTVGTPGGAMPGNPPVHSVAFYANPIMAKPVASATNTIVTVTPDQSSPASRLVAPNPNSYNTLVFAPGVHFVGHGFAIHPGKNYYIPGDAIVYGNLSNEGVPQGSFRCNGDRINVHGYGTICGILIPHYQNRTVDDTPTGTPNPEYPEWFAASPDFNITDVGFKIENAWDAKVTGITVVDPANFNSRFDSYSGRVNDQGLVSWVKLHSWRVNGDGFGGYSKVEDSFFRTSDDSTYVRDWRRRCTFWKDSNANIFRFANYISGGLEDCDIIYSRWRHPDGVGSVFEFVSYSGTQPPVMTFRNLRFHDKFSNPRHIIDMVPTNYTFSNLTFENISFYVPLNNKLSEIFGSAAAPYTGAVMFKNVTFQNGLNGSSPVRLNQTNYSNYFVTQFVDPSIFEPTTLMGSYTLTTSGPNGSIALNPPGGTYPTGTVVTVTATPNSGFSFVSWSGDLAGSLNPATITMNANKSVIANFTPDIESVPWVVNFNGLATGNTNQGAPTTWTATRGGTFRVNGNRLEVNGGGGEGVFTSGVINISNRTVNVSLDVLGAGGLDVGEDYVRLYIKVNGGGEALVQQVSGPQAAATWTTNGITGNTLQIVIRTLVTAATEYYYLDNLSITNLPAINPIVSITQPATNSVFSAGANISVTSSASDPDGTVAKVEYFIAGTTKIGQSTTGPTYGFTWTNAPAGNHSLTAMATDNVGATGVSSVVPITVRTLLQSSPQPGGQIQIQWAGGGTLQTATNVTGPWSDVSGAVSPHLKPTTNSAQFFRVKQ